MTARAVMRESGAAGLSLGEVARRMGMRTPSLYGYFASKAALCDALFSAGWAAVHACLEQRAGALGEIVADSDFTARVLSLEIAFVEWALANHELAEIMLFRPIPAWEPSQEAFSQARGAFGFMQGELAEAARLRLLRADADPDEVAENLATISTGVIARQLANEPGVPFAAGRATAPFEALCTSLMGHYVARPDA